MTERGPTTSCTGASTAALRLPLSPGELGRWASYENHLMKLLLVLISFMSLPAFAQDARSAFATVRFGQVVQVDLPRNWTYIDKKIADHLNTSSEAMGKFAGIDIAQGDNTILVAANAYDSKGKSKATLRISVRATPNITDRKSVV